MMSLSKSLWWDSVPPDLGLSKESDTGGLTIRDSALSGLVKKRRQDRTSSGKPKSDFYRQVKNTKVGKKPKKKRIRQPKIRKASSEIGRLEKCGHFIEQRQVSVSDFLKYELVHNKTLSLHVPGKVSSWTFLHKQPNIKYFHEKLIREYLRDILNAKNQTGAADLIVQILTPEKEEVQIKFDLDVVFEVRWTGGVTHWFAIQFQGPFHETIKHKVVKDSFLREFVKQMTPKFHFAEVWYLKKGGIDKKEILEIVNRFLKGETLVTLRTGKV